MILNSLLDAIFPKKCVGCGKLGQYVCDKCEVGLWEEDQICPICARNSRYGLKHSYCHKPWSLDGLSCFWAYEGVAKKLITKAKYKYFYDYLSELIVHSSLFIDRPEYKELVWFIKDNPTVVSVPLHPKRLRERGFNQAEIIAQNFSKLFNLPVASLLIRTKDTHQQVGRIRSDRLKNIQGAFSTTLSDPPPKSSGLRPGGGGQGEVLPKAVLLVDDVWTTGATLSECGATLKKAGVKKVWGLVLAR